MMKAAYALLALLLVSGCMCCGGGTGSGDYEMEDECPPPYMAYGSDCCLDANSNSICDADEYTDTMQPYVPPTVPVTMAPPTVPTTQTTDTTQPAVTTTQAPTTTLKSTYGCVENAGYEPDNFFYLYSKSGRGCGDNFINYVRTGSQRSGVGYTLIDITRLDDSEIKLMECFYGGYYEGNVEFSYCPRLLCPKTGEIENIDGRSPVSGQVSGFAKDCK